jgi:hypothetical protein
MVGFRQGRHVSAGLIHLDSLPRQSVTGLKILFGEGMSPTAELLERLPSLDRADLLDLWKNSFGWPASPGLRRELMLPILAFRIQEMNCGGLQPELATRLHELVAGRRPRTLNSGLPYKSGTKLVREWKGKVHEVLATADGFEYQRETYKTLSPIARRITGTQWSGPAFFGTKGKRK